MSLQSMIAPLMTGILALGAVGIAASEAWKTFHPDPDKFTCELIVCELAKEHFPDQGNMFLTPMLYQQMRIKE
jgi:hypothetical protein